MSGQSVYEVQHTDTETSLAVRGSLDINTAPPLAEEIDRIVAGKPKKVTVDLSALELIDSSGVAALVKLYKGVRSGGGVQVAITRRARPTARDLQAAAHG